MYAAVEITPPFFEVGPKAYMYGSEIVQLAIRADALSAEYGVQIVITPQDADLGAVAHNVERVLVFAQHMDSLTPGRGVGSALPEALRAAGAVGVLVNHAECPVSQEELARIISRADEVGLATLVCADDAAGAANVARLGPNAIIVEAPALIGTGRPANATSSDIAEADGAIWRVNPAIRVLHAAGIGNAKDVYDVIAAGAQGTGSSSAIFTANDPQGVLQAMIRATREAWDARTRGETTA
ncbi:MAG: triose-phosphate isomerase [Candidatus Dormibacteria bacterium]